MTDACDQALVVGFDCLADAFLVCMKESRRYKSALTEQHVRDGVESPGGCS